MSALSKISNSSAVHSLVGACLFVVMIFLLVMASRTGQDGFNEVRQRLGSVEVLGLRMSGAMYPVLFEFQMDFDTLTDLQTDLRAAVRRLESSPFNPKGTELVDLIKQSIALMDDFKSEQAVFRNSRAIVTQMMAELSENRKLQNPEAAKDLHAVDSAFLDFIGRRDPPSAEVFRDTVARVRTGNSAIAGTPEWRTLEAHSESLIRYARDLAQLMGSIFLLPIPQAIVVYRDRIQADLTNASVVASRYRIALFVVAVALLTFGVRKAAQVRLSVRMLNRANDELEHRVKERTKELSDANLALLSEIAERERIEAQLRIAQKLESIGQLAAGIAHEINTPAQYVNDNVNFVLGAWQRVGPILEECERVVVKGEQVDARNREVWKSVNIAFLRREIPRALESASSGLQRINQVVQATKDFSHPGSAALTPSDLNKAIQSTIVVATNEWKYVADVTTDLDPSLPLVPCNLSAFNQVVLNLVVNAAQAIAGTQRGGDLGHINVSTRHLADHVEICVEDDGPGVSADIQDRIFDPFFTTKDVGKGTGQGLSIAYRAITQQHGGTLALERASGRQGARFVIRLPTKAPESSVNVTALRARAS